jgi:hypothetical protein
MYLLVTELFVTMDPYQFGMFTFGNGLFPMLNYNTLTFKLKLKFKVKCKLKCKVLKMVMKLLLQSWHRGDVV